MVTTPGDTMTIFGPNSDEIQMIINGDNDSISTPMPEENQSKKDQPSVTYQALRIQNMLISLNKRNGRKTSQPRRRLKHAATANQQALSSQLRQSREQNQSSMKDTANMFVLDQSAQQIIGKRHLKTSKTGMIAFYKQRNQNSSDALDESQSSVFHKQFLDNEF
jgi:hypothetical protein